MVDSVPLTRPVHVVDRMFSDQAIPCGGQCSSDQASPCGGQGVPLSSSVSLVIMFL